MIKDMDAMGRKCKEEEGYWRQMGEGWGGGHAGVRCSQ